MRARICSAISCDMFARVVWLKPWGAAKSPAFALPFAARTCHAWLARLTRARGKRYIREGNALFDDFWYFSSPKSTIKEKYLYVSIRRQQATALRTKPKYSQQTKQKNMYSIPSAHGLQPRPPCTFSGRADNACTNLLGFFVRYVRTRGMVKIAESAKPPIFTLSFAARTCHAWLARLTRARRTRFGRRTARVLLADFWYFSSRKSTIKEKYLYVSSRANNVRPYYLKARISQTARMKN